VGVIKSEVGLAATFGVLKEDSIESETTKASSTVAFFSIFLLMVILPDAGCIRQRTLEVQSCESPFHGVYLKLCRCVACMCNCVGPVYLASNMLVLAAESLSM
jgi:hypothetical protein